jgi:hypothetical protein
VSCLVAPILLNEAVLSVAAIRSNGAARSCDLRLDHASEPLQEGAIVRAPNGVNSSEGAIGPSLTIEEGLGAGGLDRSRRTAKRAWQ